MGGGGALSTPRPGRPSDRDWNPGQGPKLVVGRTNLVIEDGSSVAGLLEDLLAQEGFTALVERDGEWGLDTFEERGPDRW